MRIKFSASCGTTCMWSTTLYDGIFLSAGQRGHKNWRRKAGGVVRTRPRTATRRAQEKVHLRLDSKIDGHHRNKHDHTEGADMVVPRLTLISLSSVPPSQPLPPQFSLVGFSSTKHNAEPPLCPSKGHQERLAGCTPPRAFFPLFFSHLIM